MIEPLKMRLDHFMAAANASYYAQKDPFADFITAPEISQVFGELIAVWMIVVMRSVSWQGTVALVEAGPGRGTLMSDILRVIRQSTPGIYECCKVFLIETSPRLRRVQQKKLQEHGQRVQWLDSIEGLPQLPIMMVANEFLDALPIRQFTCHGRHEWSERYVCQGQPVQKRVYELPQALVFDHPVQKGDTVEVCEAGLGFVGSVARHICTYGGAALLIDYGFASWVWGDTLQAIANQKKVSPFLPIGMADLTAHVDFPSLRETALQNGASVYGIQTQGEFLRQMGITLRAERLAGQALPVEKREIMMAVNRLIDPDEMGDLFKVMAVCHPEIPVPPAFEQVNEKRS